MSRDRGRQLDVGRDHLSVSVFSGGAGQRERMAVSRNAYHGGLNTVSLDAYWTYDNEGRMATARYPVVEDDRWLLSATSLREAFETALHGAAAATGMGKALVSGNPELINATELGDLSRRLFPPTLSGQQNADRGRGGFVGFERKYSVYEFLGFGSLHLVDETLEHGSEIERYEVLRALRFPVKEALLAFDPSGPAYSGVARGAHTLELYGRYTWYLAEQLFDNAPEVSSETLYGGARGKRWGRLVLINAHAPEEAYELSIADALATPWIRDATSTFVGLRQLSLVTDDFREACVLRTDEYSIPISGLQKIIKSASELGVG